MKEILKLLRKVKEKNKNVYICGNGGSASTANHFANDLVKMCGMKAISLCANQAIVMAYANDNGYENIFVEQLKVFYEKGDILVTISGSGTSKNIVKAQKFVTKKGDSYISFPTISIMKCSMAEIEDMHLITIHKIATQLCQN